MCSMWQPLGMTETPGDPLAERLERVERLLQRVARAVDRQWEVLESLAREAARRAVEANRPRDQ